MYFPATSGKPVWMCGLFGPCSRTMWQNLHKRLACWVSGLFLFFSIFSSTRFFSMEEFCHCKFFKRHFGVRESLSSITLMHLLGTIEIAHRPLLVEKLDGGSIRLISSIELPTSKTCLCLPFLLLLLLLLPPRCSPQSL